MGISGRLRWPFCPLLAVPIPLAQSLPKGWCTWHQGSLRQALGDRKFKLSPNGAGPEAPLVAEPLTKDRHRVHPASWLPVSSHLANPAAPANKRGAPALVATALRRGTAQAKRRP